MEQSPSEANSHLCNQEIPHLLQNPKFHNRVHKGPPLVPILSQMNPLHAPTSYPKIHFNIISPSTLSSSRWSFPFTFSYQNIVWIFNLSSLLPCVLHVPPTILDLIILTIFGKVYKWRRSSLCSLFQTLAASPLRSKYFPQHPVFKHSQSVFFP